MIHHNCSASELAAKLGLRFNGRDYTGACPSCGYRSGFSLSEKSGKVLYFCHAGGCSSSDISTALKMSQPVTVTKPSQRIGASSELAMALWQETIAAETTFVSKYLQQRGINMRIPSVLRCHPALWHSPSRSTYPAMVALVVTADNKPVAIHRTYLDPVQGKAKLEPVKMSLGPLKGCSVHFADATEKLVISEGIETGLSVMQATSLPVWVALSAGGMANMILPPLPLARVVYLAADADPVGERKALEAAKRFMQGGRTVYIVKPSQPGRDFNDLLVVPEGVK